MEELESTGNKGTVWGGLWSLRGRFDESPGNDLFNIHKKNCSSLSCVLGEAEVEATCVAQGARAREQESVG